MKFTEEHKHYFNTTTGAFSIITEREHYDSQLTFTDKEADIVLNFFKRDNIHRGPVRQDPVKSRKTFKLVETDEEVELNVVFPKKEGTELRLYLSKSAGFKPPAGNVWYIYPDSGKLWIGDMPKDEWENLVPIQGIGRNDESDFIYQESIHTNNDIKLQTLKSRDVFKRNQSIAIKRMELSHFNCEVNKSHELFVSRSTGNPYLEAHHLIPLGSNELFDSSLDIIENIFCLCPNCHRAVHHAEENFAKELLNKMVKKRNVLDLFSINSEDLHYLYSI